MSQYRPQVLASDGLWYHDPIITGDGWMLFFDDDEACLSIDDRKCPHYRREKGEPRWPAMKSAMEAVLSEVGIKAEVKGWGHIEITEPIPAELMPGFGKTGRPLEEISRRKGPNVYFYCGVEPK